MGRPGRLEWDVRAERAYFFETIISPASPGNFSTNVPTSQEIWYVFKHFPLQFQGKAFELSAMICAVQQINQEAFWQVHDFLFTDEGEAVVKGGNEAVKQKVEQILKESGYGVQAFQNALEAGKGKKGRRGFGFGE